MFLAGIFELTGQRRHDVVVKTTAKLHLNKPDACSNPARGMSEIHDGENF